MSVRWSVGFLWPPARNMLAGVETAEREIGGLTGGIPVLAGQSTIDDLLPGLHGLLASGVPANAANSAPEGTAPTQPALF